MQPFSKAAVGYFGADTMALSHIILTEDNALCHPMKAPFSSLSLLEAFVWMFHPNQDEKPAHSSSSVRSFRPSAMSLTMAVRVTSKESLPRAIRAAQDRHLASNVLGELVPGLLQSFVFRRKPHSGLLRLLFTPGGVSQS